MRDRKSRILGTYLVILLLLVCPRLAIGQPSTDSDSAIAKYHLGQTRDAIDDLERLFGSLTYESDQVAFIQTARLLLDLYWRVEDPNGIHSVRSRAADALKDRQPLDDADRFLIAYAESSRVRELLLRGDRAAARQHGLQLLEFLQTPMAMPYRVARIEVVSTLAMVARAEFNLAEAESYMHQAIGLALQDDQLHGVAAFEFVESLLRHYVESGQYQYAALIVARLAKVPAAFRAMSERSVSGFSAALLFAELMLQTVAIDSSEPFLQALLNLEQLHGGIQGLPSRLTVQLYAILLYLRLERNEVDGAQHAFGKLEEFYQKHPTDAKGIANVLAWAAYRLGSREVAARYVEAGRSDRQDLNIYLYSLNRLVAALLDRDAGSVADASRNAQESFWATLRNVAVRGSAAPAAALNLSFAERVIVTDFVRVALDVSAAGVAGAVSKEHVSLALQLLQRDRIPRGALFAPGLRVAATANLEEHLRAREHLAQGRYRAALSAVDLLVQRAAAAVGGPALKVYDFLETQRFFEYGFRVNALDTYLRPLVYSHGDFVASRLALVPPQDLQRVMAADEALVSHAVIAKDRLVIECVTRSTVEFFSVPLEIHSFVANVKALNLSLSATHQPSPTFDRQYPAAAAVEVYQTLFAPAANCLADKRRLIIATDGELLGVPFNALLTAMPPASAEGYDLKRAPWMIRKWAVSVSLARSTLLYQRSRPAMTRGRRSFVGIGNPRFDGAPKAGRVESVGSVYTARGTAWVEAIRSLPALTDTEEELRRIRSYLGEGDSVLFLGDDATERNVRSQDLDEYRIIAFATHGLTAGEFDALAEPALALTPGDAQDSRNDGLLGMSEISRLWITADLVVLSACNTASGDGTPNALGFSGLVNAFFFAGARAVLASQWPVFSHMAETLTTGMFASATSEPAQPPNVALQRAMLRIIDESPEPEYAHPRFWAPFLLAGDGPPPSGSETGSPSTATGGPLRARWERNLGEKLAGEIIAVSVDAHGDGYAMGFTEPQNERAKSIVLSLDSQGTERWRLEDPVIGAGAHLLRVGDDRIAAAGSLWSQDRYEGAILRVLESRNGAEVWRRVIDTTEHERTLGLLAGPGEQLLWIVGSHVYARDKAAQPRLAINLVRLDSSGAVVGTQTQELSGPGIDLYSGSAAVRWQGHILVAVNASRTTTDVREVVGKESRDVASGYSTWCSTRNVTRLVVLDETTGRLVAERTFDRTHVKSFAVTSDQRLLAAADAWDTCLGSRDATVVEISSDLSLKTLFRYGGPLEKTAWDITVLPDGRLVLVGSTTLLFDLDPYVKRDSWDPQQFVRGFTGELFESDRKTSSAFVVVLDRNGNFLADRVIRDLRGRSIRAVSARGDGSVLFGGLANGVSSWFGIANVD